MRTLRDFGFGKTRMEDLVGEEVEETCRRFEMANGEFIRMDRKFNIPAVNALYKVLSHERLSHDDPRPVEYHKKSEEIFRIANKPWVSFIGLVPYGYVITRMLGYPTLEDFFKGQLSVIDDFISKHESTYQEDNLRDFTDAYLQKSYAAASDPTSSFHGKEGKVNLRSTLADILQAGTDTTSITMSWAMVYLTNYPHIQKKLQEELDCVIGRGRVPTWNDKQNLPYTEACLHELQRRANIIPNGVARKTRKDCYLRGHFIPADTNVFPMLGAVLHNPKIFPSPKEFKPERFLVDGKFEASPYVIPFGSGKRRCLGETLARIELFRFFTGIFHRFNVEKRPGDINSDDPSNGSFAMPDSFEVRFIPRD